LAPSANAPGRATNTQATRDVRATRLILIP
jgi:hypothetical protein